MKNSGYEEPLFEFSFMETDVVTNSMCPNDIHCVTDNICDNDWDIN